MKKLSFILLALVTMTAFGQSNLYTFSKSTITYSELNNALKYSPSNFPGSLPFFTIVLPFSFTVNNATSEAINISDEGLITLVTSDFGKKNIISAGRLALNDRAADAGVYVQTDGEPGSRIFKLEFRNYQPYWAGDNDIINYQVWLYEGSNNVEIRYGATTNFDLGSYSSSEGPMIGILHSDTVIINIDSSFFVYGSESAPTFAYTQPEPGLPPVVSNHIAQGTVFKFTRKSSGSLSVPEAATGTVPAVNVYPNPVSGNNINIEVHAQGTVTLTLTDLYGRTLQTQTLATGETHARFDATLLSVGIYLVTVQNNGEVATRKVQVK